MFERFFRFFKELDGRVKVVIASTGIQNWGQRLSEQYSQLYAQDLGADAVELGFLSSVAAAVGSIASIPTGWAAENYTVKKVMLSGFACLAISATIFALSGNWLMLIPAFILGQGLFRIMALTDIIFISVMSPQQRATVMGLSRVVWGVLNVFAPMTAALIVTNFGGINAQGIRPLYYIQLILTMTGFLFVAWKLQPLPIHIDKKTNAGSMRSLIEDFKELFKGEKWLKRWIALRTVRQFGMNLAMPFVSLWMVNVKGATPYILGIMGTVSTIMSLVLQIPAGRLADKVGRKKVFYILRPISYLGTVLLILTPSPGYLIFVGLLGAIAVRGGGGISGSSNTVFVTMLWELVPAEKRGRWYGIDGLMNLAVIPASILGGILWAQGFRIEVLLIPIFLEALVALPILTTIPDTLDRPKQ